MPAQRSLGRAVRIERVLRDLSQEELGNRSGLHRNYVGAIERGEINPTFGTLLRVARGLRLGVPELIARWVEVEADRTRESRPA